MIIVSPSVTSASPIISADMLIPKVRLKKNIINFRSNQITQKSRIGGVAYNIAELLSNFVDVNFYSLDDISLFATTSKRLSKLLNALSVLLFGKKLRGNLIPKSVDGKLKNKGYRMMVASKHRLPFD